MPLTLGATHRQSDSQADETLFPDPAYRKLLRTLKRAIDPDDIIAPGRYIPRE